jgi:hypothetical protein
MLNQARTWLMCAALFIGVGAAHPGTDLPPSAEAMTSHPEAYAGKSRSECSECPVDRLYCNAERAICICDVSGDIFRSGECPAPGGADPSPPDDCPPIHWWCNISGDCRCSV